MYQSRYESGAAGFYREAAESVVAGAVEGDIASAANPNAQPAGGPYVSCLISPDPAEHELQLLAQMGVGHCFTWLEATEHLTEEYISGLKARCAKWGVTLYNVGCRVLGKNPAIILGLPGRDEAIEALCDFVRVLGRAGVGVTTFTWEPDGVWSVARATTRGGASARAMDADALRDHPLTHGRDFSEEELWANLAVFLERVLPVAAESHVRLALHPNDPPVDFCVAGKPCLIRSRAAYERVYALARSVAGDAHSWLAMEFCCGCWLEGGSAGFGPIYDSLADFVAADRVAIVHLRNVTSPLPRFAETFLDGGYGDMNRLLRILVRGRYSGTVILDHTPSFVAEAGPSAASAFAIGYMKACIRAAVAELAGGYPEDDARVPTFSSATSR